MYLKALQLISSSVDFFHVTSVFTLEKYESFFGSTFFGYRSESFHVEVSIHSFFFPINNVAYFALRNFNTMHITKFLNRRIGIYLFGKSKHISLNPQLIYKRHFERRINLKAADDISNFK